MNVHRRRDSRRLKRWWLGVGLTTLVGCDNLINDGPCGGQAAGTSKLAVWWGSHGGGADNAAENAEERALSQLQGRYSECNPDVTIEVQQFVDRADLTGNMDKYLAAASNGKAPSPDDPEYQLPDVVQLNAGDTALKYSGCREGQAGILAPLPEDLLSAAWRSQLEHPVDKKVAKYGGKPEEGAALANWDPWNSLMHVPMPENGLVVTVAEDYERWIHRYISCEVEGSTKYWMAPIAVHHVNRLYFNKARADDLVNGDFEKWVSESHRSSMTGWLSAIEQLAAEPGREDVPLFALPTEWDSRWALSLLAAENVRVALTQGLDSQPENSEVTHSSNEVDAADPAVADAKRLSTARAVMGVMARLLRLAQQQPASVQDAMNLVKSGQAVFTVMGDWAWADVNQEEVGMVAFPGTQNTLVYTIDGFVAIDKRKPGERGELRPQANAWMKVVGTGRTPWDFADTKGAVAVHDWRGSVASCADVADKLHRDCVVIPALSMREEACRIEDALYEWSLAPNDFTAREWATYQLAGCLQPPEKGIEALSGVKQEDAPNSLKPPVR